MKVENYSYGEELIKINIPTKRAVQYLDWFTMAGWHRCNSTYRRDYKDVVDKIFMLVTISGEGTLITKGQKHKLTEGTVAIVPPHTPMTYFTSKDSWEFYWLNVGGKNITYISSELWQENLIVNKISHQDKFYNIINILLNATEAIDKPSETKISQYIYNLLNDIVEGLFFKVTTKSENIADNIKGWMEENYAQNITIKKLSRVFFLSENQIIRVFNKHTGYTPLQYLKQYRLLKACEFLYSSDLPVKIVGDKAGYKNASHFAAQFKKEYGMSPAKYRALYSPKANNG